MQKGHLREEEMPKRSKRYQEVAKLVKRSHKYSLDEAVALLGKTKSAKFDETIEVAIQLGVDPRKADQNVRGGVALPHGLGKDVRVIVFAKGEKVAEAEAAGAEIVGGDELVEKIKAGWQEFDNVVATPDMMVHVGKVGKILGPRGLMPSPKVGTVTFDVGETVRAIKAGRAEFRVDKAGIVHTPAGKASFSESNIKDNILAIVATVNRLKPTTSKGIYLQSAAMSLTMGPGIEVDVTPLRNS
jgi:large subunit ribosomal protein L1